MSDQWEPQEHLEPFRTFRPFRTPSLSPSVELPVGRSLEVLLWTDGFHTSKIIQHPHLKHRRRTSCSSGVRCRQTHRWSRRFWYLCDVELGEEPVVVPRPVHHLRVAGEQSFLGELRLRAVHLEVGRGGSGEGAEHLDVQVRTGVCRYLEHGSRQDDVSAQRALRVEALLPAVICLSQRHRQGCLRVHLQGAGPGTGGHSVLWINLMKVR